MFPPLNVNFVLDQGHNHYVAYWYSSHIVKDLSVLTLLCLARGYNPVI